MSNLTKAPLKNKAGSFNFDLFDSLPREVRDAINYAAFQCATSNLPGLVHKKGGTAVAAAINAWDKRNVDEAYAVRDAADFLKDLGL